MQGLARDFPSALRELEATSTAERQRRQGLAVALHLALLSGDQPKAAALWGTLEAAPLRCGVALHRHLRQHLELKRWLAGRVVDPALLAAASARFAIDRATVEAIARPRGGRLSAAAYAAVAAGEGITAATVEAILFPGSSADGGG